MKIRKRISIIFILVLLITLCGCSGGNGIEDQIIGKKWEIMFPDTYMPYALEFQKDGSVDVNGVEGSGSWYKEGENLMMICPTERYGEIECHVTFDEDVIKVKDSIFEDTTYYEMDVFE